MFPISAFSRLCGLTPRALRIYDGLGLFTPAWVDPFSGYRYYSPAQLPDLRRIIALRDMGLPLAEIRESLRAGTDLRVSYERRRTELAAERLDLDRRLAALDITVDMAAGAADAPDIVLRRVPREPVATLRLALVPYEDTEAAFDELEAHVRDLGARAHLPPGALLATADWPDPNSDEIFVPLLRHIRPTDRVGYRILPAARVATLLHRGSYAGLNAARAALENWVAGTGLVRSGPLRVLYLQFGADRELSLPKGWVVDQAADYLTELQLSVA